MGFNERLKRVEEAADARAAAEQFEPWEMHVPAAILADAEAIGLLLAHDGADGPDWPLEVEARIVENAKRISQRLPPIRYPADPTEFDSVLAEPDVDATAVATDR